MTRQDVSVVLDAEKHKLNQRLESIGWALFLIMIGGLGVVPGEQVGDKDHSKSMFFSTFFLR